MCLGGTSEVAGDVRARLPLRPLARGGPGAIRRAGLAGEHLLYGLPTDSELARDVCLRDALLQESIHQIAPLGAKLTRDLCVLDRLGSDFLDAAERLFVCGCGCHASIMTTTGCRVNPTLSSRPKGCPTPASSCCAGMPTTSNLRWAQDLQTATRPPHGSTRSSTGRQRSAGPELGCARASSAPLEEIVSVPNL